MYEIILTKTFADELKKLEKKESERIKKKLETAKENPWLYFQRLAGYEFFRLRVGKYRIIASIIPREKRIYLMSVRLRKKAYDRL